MELRILSAAEVVQALPMAAAIEGMKTAFAQLSAGQVTVPVRVHVGVPQHDGVSLFMPALLHQSGDLAVKVVSVFPHNPTKGLPVINGIVLVLDETTGVPRALMDGGSLTAVRTGAVSGAATDLLANPDASSVAIIGSGVQARTQLEAVCTVRQITAVYVYSPNRDHAEAFAAAAAGRGPIPANVVVVHSAETAVSQADIICAATSSYTPVFDGRALKPGAHVNGVGSFRTTMQEIDLATVQRSLVVVDSREAMWEEAGDLVIPLNAGDIAESHIHAELGELVSGAKPGRTSRDQITFFKSVGVAVQDAISGRIALENAVAHGLGTLVQL